VSLFVNTFFEERLRDLFSLAGRVKDSFNGAGIEYRAVGGLAVYLYVEEAEADAGRLTKDIDIVVRRTDLPRIAEAVEAVGLEYRDVAGTDMLVQKGKPSARRAIHLIYDDSRVNTGGPTLQGIPVVPLAALVAMKLTSFRIKDEMHVKDLDEQRLITPEIEAELSPLLLDRLARVRARD
jgi:hypothetical protein